MDPTASSIISMVLFFIMVGAQARTEPGLSKLVVMLWARWLISRCCLCSVQIIMAVTLTYMCCARACRRTRVQRTTVVMEAQVCYGRRAMSSAHGVDILQKNCGRYMHGLIPLCHLPAAAANLHLCGSCCGEAGP